jgi:hypothetical protein
MLFSVDLSKPCLSADEILDMLANLVYLARQAERGSAGQFYCLDLAADLIRLEQDRRLLPLPT